MQKKFELEDTHYGNLKNIKMTCDNPLTTKRKIHPPFPNQSFFMMVIGAPGSGKSTFLFNMLQKQKKGQESIYYRVFKNILYVCPPNSRSTVENNPLADLAEDSVFDELDYKVQDKIIENKDAYNETPEKHYKQLLIIDDCSAFLKDKTNVKILSELSKNRRHLGLSIIILAQDIIDIPKSTRRQISALVVFKPPNNSDLDVIRKEFVNIKKPDFEELARFVFRDKHDHLFVDKNTNDLFRNLQKIIMH